MLTPRSLVPLRRILFACGVFLLGLSSALAQTAISTLAGSSPAIASGNVNATGTAARFNALTSVAVDSAENIYVADAGNHTIRKVTAAGVVTTLAGSGVADAANGTGAAASFRFPQGVATDGTNVYVADTYNHAIRKIVISTGVVTTLAGTVGTSGTANGTGVAATFNNPLGLAVSGADLYVADTGSHSIRKIVIGSGAVTTFAGTAGTNGFADGTGVAATFNGPSAIAADGTTNLYVADTGNHTIRKIVIDTAAVTTFAGTGNGTGGSTDSTGAAASFNLPRGLVVSGANLFVADTGNNIIRQIVHATGVVTTIAGTAGSIGTTDAIGTAARFQGPTGIGISTGGTLYIADTNNHTLRAGAAMLVGFHTADTNRDFRIGLLELIRVIELYNTRFDTGAGTARTGRYQIATATEDGFSSDVTRDPTAVVALPTYHAADYNFNGRIERSELTRVITLYHTRYDTGAGKVRTGLYKVAVGITTVDGYTTDPTRAP